MTVPSLGTGGSANLDTNESLLFDSRQNGGPCSAYSIVNTHSANSFKGRVSGMHIDNTSKGGTDGKFTVPAGATLEVTWWGDGIEQVYGHALSGNVTIRGAVTAKGG